MLIHPRDAALDTAEWQEWLAGTDRFGMLAVRERVIDRLQQRGRGADIGAATQQLRRLAAIGDWRTHRERS